MEIIIHWIIILIFATACYGQDGFECYSCTYSYNPSKENYACVTDPRNYTGGANKVPCDTYQMCFVEKTTSLFDGEIQELLRGCGEVLDGCDGDQYEQTCTTSCTTPLCNGQNEAPVTSTVTSGSSTTTRDPNTFIECYNCNYNAVEDTGNELCVDAPEAVPDQPDAPHKASCPQGDVCYIIRIHDRESKKVSLITRSCDDYGDFYDRCEPILGTTEETCTTTCDTDLCNDGDGIISAASRTQYGMIYICFIVLLQRHIMGIMEE